MAPIHDAARSGDALGLAKVVDVWGVEAVHAQHHQTQWTPLMIAASRGHTQAVHFLLEHGACVDFVAKGYTALYLAAREGRGGVVKLLLDRGADPAIKTNVGWSTLMMAANRGHLDIVSLLLATGVDVDEQSNGGRTALWLACRWGHVHVAAALLRGGADYTLGTKDCDYGNGGDKSPKDVALEHGYADVVAVIESVEKGYLLHKVRALHDAQLRQERFPHLPPPPFLASHCPAPSVDMEGMGEGASVYARTALFVTTALHEELFRELMEAFLPLPLHA